AQTADLVQEHRGLVSACRDVLHRTRTHWRWRQQPVLPPELHEWPHALVLLNPAGRIRQLRGGPFRDVSANAQNPLHGPGKAERQRRDAARLLVRHVGDPVGHYPRSVRSTVAVLDRQAVDSIRVVAGPYLVGPTQHPQIRTAATARARLEQDMRKLLSKQTQ